MDLSLLDKLFHLLEILFWTSIEQFLLSLQIHVVFIPWEVNAHVIQMFLPKQSKLMKLFSKNTSLWYLLIQYYGTHNILAKGEKNTELEEYNE